MLSLAHNASQYDSALNLSLVTKTIGFHGLEPELKSTLIQLLGQLTMPILWREVTDKDAEVVFLNDTAFNWLTGRSKAQGIDEKRCIVLSDNAQAAIHPLSLIHI